MLWLPRPPPGEGHERLPFSGGPAKDQPVPTVVRCRKRQQDVAPNCEGLVATRTGVMNQLRAGLERFWPGALRLFSHMDAEILLAFLERYPSPADAHGVGVARMQAFLVRERYSGGQHPTTLMAKLRSAPRARIGELELAARRPPGP